MRTAAKFHLYSAVAAPTITIIALILKAITNENAFPIAGLGAVIVLGIVNLAVFLSTTKRQIKLRKLKTQRK